ncbi:MAG: MATE family efflux transporter [Burkholderiaceae bacterium]|jgi:MATE family multidrug resistance protein|nr:MATE family efflux transporter [Burkholderiaceae bacterium]
MKPPALASPNLTARIAGLAAPILVGQLAAIANPVLDTLMVARYSAADLAALSVGASIYVSIFVGLNGVMQSLMPTFGQLYGAGALGKIAGEARQGSWLAVLMAIVGMLFLFFPAPFFSLTRASPELMEKVSLYLRILAFSLPASMLFLVYVTLNNALARPRMVMVIQVGALFLKLPLNLLLVFGGWHIPAFGAPGCAIATLILSWTTLTVGLLILRTHPFYHFLRLPKERFTPPRWQSLKELLKLGLPLGMNYFIEVTAFTFMSLFITRIGINAVAGHQVVANMATTLYMLPLSTAGATGALVAQAIGARKLPLARQIAFSGLRLAVCVAVVMATLLWCLRHIVVGLYTDNPGIVGNALPLVLFVCTYQIFDALQAVSSHILRAHKVVLAPTVLYVAALWCIGLGGGYLFAFNPFGLDIPQRLTGASGFWFCNALGLVLLSGVFLLLVNRVERRAENA